MIQIFGAGMAGLLAANMLRRHSPTIYEAQSELPNNHTALLRFRTDKVSKETGIPFKKVTVRKALKYKDELIDTPSISACNQYSLKVTGNVLERSAWNLEPVERYIAPLDFISQCANSVDIEYDRKLDLQLSLIQSSTTPKISTVPMNILMDLVGWKEKPEFKYVPIWSYKIYLDPNHSAYQTIYYADEHFPVYRASITGQTLIVEYIRNILSEDGTGIAEFVKSVKTVLNDFGFSYTRQGMMNIDKFIDPNANDGISEFKYHKYGKLLPIDEQLRKEFILAMTDQYNLYSIGRFATWRQLLMDDVVNDVRLVENFITERDSYKRKLAK